MLAFPPTREREGQLRPLSLSLSGAALAVSQDLNSGCPISAFSSQAGNDLPPLVTYEPVS